MEVSNASKKQIAGMGRERVEKISVLAAEGEYYIVNISGTISQYEHCVRAVMTSVQVRPATSFYHAQRLEVWFYSKLNQSGCLRYPLAFIL